MTTQDVIENLGLKQLSEFEHRDVDGVFISDMLSDVMAGAKSGNLWVTVQTHKNIVPAANLVGNEALSGMVGFIWALSAPLGSFVVVIGAALIATERLSEQTVKNAA